MQERFENRVTATEVNKKSSGVSQKRARAANPLIQHRWVVLPLYKQLKDEGILQTDQPEANHIHNYDEMAVNDDGKVNRICTLKFQNKELNNCTERQVQVKSGEHGSFHNSLLVGNNASGSLDDEAEPFLIKQSSETDLRGDLIWGLDKHNSKGLYIGIGHSSSGYSTQEIFDRMIRRLVHRSKCTKTDPHFAFFDAHDSHMGPKTLQYCLNNGMYVFFFPSNNSINDQPEDNGPNGMLEAIINRRLQEWNLHYPSICMNQVYMNVVLADALLEFTMNPKRVQCVVNAFARTNLHPMIPFFKPDYSNISDELRANPELLKRLKDRVLLSIPFVHDPEEQRILRLITEANYETVDLPIRINAIEIKKYSMGLEMDTIASTTNQVTGEVYTMLVAGVARDQLNNSTIVPTQQLMKEAQEQKSLKKIRLQPNDLNGDNDNDGLNIYNVRNTTSGCLVTPAMIALLEEKKQLKEVQEIKTKENKISKILKANDIKKAQTLLKKDAIKYFKLHGNEKERKLWIKAKLQPEIHNSIKAFGGSVLDPNGNGKTVLKIDLLKINLYSLISEAIENELNPETNDDDDDDDDEDEDEDELAPETNDDDDSI